MFEGNYIFNGVSRLGLWFHQPNLAGCFLVFCYFGVMSTRHFFQQSRRVPVIFFLIESGILCLIAMTLSRGSIVSLACVALVLAVLFIIRNKGNVVEILRGAKPEMLKAAIFVAMLFLTGAILRFSSMAANTDASSQHRIEIFRGGMAVIVDNPWSGVGMGNSGDIYTNWYGPLAGDYQVATLISGTLTLICENGLWMTAVLAFCHLFPLLVVIKVFATSGNAARRRGVALGYFCAGLLSMMLCNWFTCIYISGFLLVLFIIAVVASLVWTWQVKLFQLAPLKNFGGVLAMTAFAMVVFYASCLVLNKHEGAIYHDGIARISGANGQNKQKDNIGVFIWDSDVLGYYYGRFIRKFAAETSQIAWISPTNRFDGSVGKNAKVVVFAGNLTGYDNNQRFPNAKIVLLSPLRALRPDARKFDLLILPELDTSRGGFHNWREYAVKIHAKVDMTKGTGYYMGDSAQAIALIFNELI